MLSSTYLLVKSAKIDILHQISHGGRCIFPKVGEWIARHADGGHRLLVLTCVPAANPPFVALEDDEREEQEDPVTVQQEVHDLIRYGVDAGWVAESHVDVRVCKLQ